MQILELQQGLSDANKFLMDEHDQVRGDMQSLTAV